tara:strand:- start:814 stop:2124 length:1311 start_codon:yes stop_codon:yes gene_type:complete
VALTKISTDGVDDDAITSGKIPANAVGTSEIAGGAVDSAKLSTAVNSAITLNTNKVTNATHTGDVTGSTSLTIANNAVNNAKVASNAAIDGTKISPNFGSQHIVTTGPITMSGGLTNATTGNAHIVLDSGTGSAAGNQLSYIDFKINGTVKGNIAVSETSSGLPLELNSATGTGAVQLYNAGSLKLYTHTNGVVSVGNLGAGDHVAPSWVNVIYAGDSMDLQFKHDGNNSVIENYTGDLYIQNNYATSASNALYIRSKAGENSISCFRDGGVELYHDGTKIVSTSATGILFNNDTSANNALGDYEEGTWTPYFAGYTTAGTFGYASQVGRYTKIGNIVHYEFEIRLNAITSAGAGMLNVRGLPYTGNGVPYYSGGSLAYYENWASGITPSGILKDVNNDRLFIYKNNQAVNRLNMDSSNLTANTRLIASGTYLTNT